MRYRLHSNLNKYRIKLTLFLTAVPNFEGLVVVHVQRGQGRLTGSTFSVARYLKFHHFMHSFFFLQFTSFSALKVHCSYERYLKLYCNVVNTSQPRQSKYFLTFDTLQKVSISIETIMSSLACTFLTISSYRSTYLATYRCPASLRGNLRIVEGVTVRDCTLDATTFLPEPGCTFIARSGTQPTGLTTSIMSHPDISEV